MISEDVSSALAGIDVPVLVLGADHDPIEPVSLLAEHVVARIAGAALEVISDSGHLIPLEQPQQVADRITAFVDRVPQPPLPAPRRAGPTSEPTGGNKMTVTTATQNTETVQRLFDAFRSGDTNAFEELIVEDFVQHNPQVDNGRVCGAGVLRSGRSGRRRSSPHHRGRATWSPFTRTTRPGRPQPSTSFDSTTKARSSSTGTFSNRSRTPRQTATTCSASSAESARAPASGGETLRLSSVDTESRTLAGEIGRGAVVAVAEESPLATQPPRSSCNHRVAGGR